MSSWPETFRREFFTSAFFALLALSACGVKESAKAQRSDLGAAQMLASGCSGCHSDTGQQSAVISLDGFDSASLTSKLNAYRSDPTNDTAMHRIAKGYSDEEIHLIAEALTSPPVP